MKPERYFYLVEIDSDEIKAVFTADQVGEAEMIAFERELRTRYGVEAPGSGLDLRDSAEHPLRAEVWAHVEWRRNRL